MNLTKLQKIDRNARLILPAVFAAVIFLRPCTSRAQHAPATANASPALTLDAFSDLARSDTLTGALSNDWQGLRTKLAEKGLTFDLSVTQVYQGVLNGGLDKGWNYGGRENLAINLDTQKMGLWPGGFFYLEGEGNYGEFIGARQTGAILPVDTNQVFPSTDTPNFKLPALQMMQFVAPQIGFVFGKLDTITTGDQNEFAHGKGGEGFLNTAFCFDPVAALVVPYSTLGVGLVLLPTSNANELIITLSMIDTEGEPGDCGFSTAFKGGTSYVAEGRYTTHFFGLTGHQLVGGGYSDRRYTDLDQDLRNFIIPRLPIQQSAGSWYANYNFDQYVYQPDPKINRGIGIFGRVGTSDGIANPIHLFLSGGIGGKGIVPGRPDDQFGIGYYYIQTTDARIPERLSFGDSHGFEAYYELAVTRWLHFTPDIQYIQPSQDRVGASVILGARLETKF